MPAGASAWISIALFGLVDASCFQVLRTYYIPSSHIHYAAYSIAFQLAFEVSYMSYCKNKHQASRRKYLQRSLISLISRFWLSSAVCVSRFSL